MSRVARKHRSNISVPVYKSFVSEVVTGRSPQANASGMWPEIHPKIKTQSFCVFIREDSQSDCECSFRRGAQSVQVSAVQL